MRFLTLPLALALAAGLIVAGTSAAENKSVRLAMNGTCTQTLHNNKIGTTLSVSTVCTASGKCSCQGASTTLDYTLNSVEPGTGADGRESGTLVAKGPKGTVTLSLKGTHTALGAGKGTWTLVKSSGFTGVTLAKRGTYTTTQREVSHVMTSPDSVVNIAARVGCWYCAT